MKALVFMGSPRYEGNTAKLCSVLYSSFRSRDIECTVLTPSDSHKPCKHCGYCSINKCCISDPLQYWINNLDDYDVIVIMTPIYFFSFSAQTKIFIDRIGAGDLSNKIFVLVTSSGSKGRMGGNDLLVKAIERTCEYHGCKFAGYYNKVTNDEILSIIDKDKLNIDRLTERVIKLKERMK